MRRLLMIALVAAALFTTNSLQAVTGGAVVREIRLLIDEADSSEGGSHWSNADIRLAWNMAQRGMSHWTPLVEDDTALQCVDKKIMYPLAGNVARVAGVWFRPDKGVWLRVERASGDEFGKSADTVQSRATDQKKPLQYNFHKGEVKIFPVLLEPAPDDSLMIDLYRYPNDMVNDASTVELVGYAILPCEKLTIWILQNGLLSYGDEQSGMANLEAMARMFLQQGGVEVGR